ncbi:MAG: lytic transglycosylase [Paenibacillus sp.]|jgi:soluble lytic murein transglycosylase-like protein|nr:lytic transglycosylase [Paenibacillus sp.]
MNIDPRLITQLLQLQFQTSDPLSLRNASAEDAGDFSALLESLIGKKAAEGKTAALGTGGYPLPVSAYSANTALHSLQRSAYGPAKPSAYDPIVEEASERHGVEPGLVKAVIHSESSFNPYAVSSSGAKGLMQLMDSTGSGMGVSDPFDPAQNIEGGTRYLSGLLRKYDGNEAVALAAYNAGPGRVDRLGIRTDADLKERLHLLPRETQQYVGKVLERKEQYDSSRSGKTGPAT